MGDMVEYSIKENGMEGLGQLQFPPLKDTIRYSFDATNRYKTNKTTEKLGL